MANKRTVRLVSYALILLAAGGQLYLQRSDPLTWLSYVDIAGVLIMTGFHLGGVGLAGWLGSAVTQRRSARRASRRRPKFPHKPPAKHAATLRPERCRPGGDRSRGGPEAKKATNPPLSPVAVSR